MTLDQLRIFVAVAERQHVTRAAEALNLTQSAVSGAIAALEQRHGVPLFDRIGRGIALTGAGRMFLPQARTILSGVASAERALADHAGLQRGTLTLVASQTIASYWLPPRLASFHARHPQIKVELLLDNSRGAARRVLDGTADLGFVEGAIDAPALAAEVVADDRLVLVARDPAPDVDAAWLRAARWIGREPGSGTRSSVEATLASHGVDPDALDIAMTLPSNEAVRTAVEAGASVAILSTLVVAGAIAGGDLHALPLALPTRSFRMVRHKERHRTRAGDALAAIIREALA